MRRWTGWLFGVLTLFFAIWGITQYMAKQNLAIRLENSYQRAFYELTYNIDSIETLLTQSMASNSRERQMKFFSDTWRQASAAQSNLGQLPFSKMPMARTEKFISQVEAFCFNLFRKVGGGEDVSGGNLDSLKGYAQQAKHIKESLSKMQPLFENNPSWEGIEKATMAQIVAPGKGGTAPGKAGKRPSEAGSLENNPVVKSFMMMEDGLKRYPDPDFEGNMLNFRERPRGFTGSQITRNRAIEIARKFVAPGKQNELARVVATEKGDVPAFHVEVIPRKQEQRRGKNSWRTLMSISQKGGHLIWMITERNVGKQKLTASEARVRGQNYLKSLGYEGMESLAAEQFDGVVNVSYVRKIGDVWIYPEEIKLQIAHDNGEILAFEAMSYLTFKGAVRAPAYPLTRAQAQGRLQKRLKVERVRKAVIVNDRFKQVATYEFKTALGKERFLIYINAVTGDEEKVIREIPGQTEII